MDYCRSSFISLRWVALFVSTGDWWKSFDAAAEWHDHEVHGAEAGASAEVMPSHREAETRKTVTGARTGVSLPHPWAISPVQSQRWDTDSWDMQGLHVTLDSSLKDWRDVTTSASRAEKVCCALLTHYLIPSSVNHKLFKSDGRHLTRWNPKGKESL